MISGRKPPRRCKTIYSVLCLAVLAVSIPNPQKAQGQPWTLAQASIPSAGAVLGWELNMNRIYTPKLDPGVPASQTNSGQQAPVIFYDLKHWPVQPTRQDRPFLLNTPNPGR
ncbi:hypothetical protein [Vampirovibrio chlorellavorus]|uniref:hypothetical protein n=1 Tax=Vampirovibrio chlorellavorus TaxID=758823 RepID=UPI0026EAD152|nr:hypothetical protein [Vampirovibrio chlorellavorus]